MVNTQTYDLNLIFRALGDPTRRAMLRDLIRRERHVTKIGKPFEMSLAAVSKHVKVLERARLIRRRREGSFSYLSVNNVAMRRANQWMEPHRKLWEERLDALAKYVEKGPAAPE